MSEVGKGGQTSSADYGYVDWIFCKTLALLISQRAMRCLTIVVVRYAGHLAMTNVYLSRQADVVLQARSRNRTEHAPDVPRPLEFT